MDKFFFSTDTSSERLGNRDALQRVREVVASLRNVDVACLDDRPLRCNVEITRVGDVGVLKQSGTLNRIVRTSEEVARQPDAGFHLGVMLSAGPALVSQPGWERPLHAGQAVLFNSAEPASVRSRDGISIVSVALPRAPFLDRLPNAEDIARRELHLDPSAMRLLARYLEMLGKEKLEGSAALDAHVRGTVIDLVALAIAGQGESSELAQGRGLRAARTAHILAEIKASFSNPAFSPHAIARKLGVTTRYVQELLAESGSTFTDRVMESRLQRARAMLMDRRHDTMSTSS
jgi:hypothetical protein